MNERIIRLNYMVNYFEMIGCWYMAQVIRETIRREFDRC